MSPGTYARGFGWNLLFNLVTKLATPIIGVLVARKLGPETMGAYMVLVTVMTFADLFREAGIARVYLNEPEMTDSRERGYAGLSAVIGLALALLLAVGSWPLAKLFGSPQLAIGLLFGAAAMCLNGLSTIPQAKLLREGRLKEAGFAETLGSVLSSVYALAGVLAGFGFLALASQLLVRSFIFLVATYRMSPCTYTRGEKGLFRKIAGVSGSLTGVNLLWVAFSVGDQAIAGKMLGLAAAGLYGTGKLIVTTADVIAKPLQQTVTVAFAHRVNDQELIARTLHKSLLAFLIAIAPIYAAVAFLADPIVLSVLGTKYAGTVQVLPALCLYGAVVYNGSFAGNALLMIGKQNIALYGWLGTMTILGIVLTIFWTALPLLALAWVFAGALTLVNASTFTFALRYFPPARKTVMQAAKAICCFLLTAAFAALIARLQISDLAKLATAMFVLPAVHLLFLGTFFAKKPSGMLSPAGIKQLWQSL
ncbi:MAG: oligosaccharide flippase family protein [Fimbriimonas sp.]